tara:strand:+ start:1683 stop:1985 length:303 start_codon:yes stop_codon:yes gene_type:complete
MGWLAAAAWTLTALTAEMGRKQHVQAGIDADQAQAQLEAQQQMEREAAAKRAEGMEEEATASVVRPDKDSAGLSIFELLKSDMDKEQEITDTGSDTGYMA